MVVLMSGLELVAMVKVLVAATLDAAEGLVVGKRGKEGNGVEGLVVGAPAPGGGGGTTRVGCSHANCKWCIWSQGAQFSAPTENEWLGLLFYEPKNVVKEYYVNIPFNLTFL